MASHFKTFYSVEWLIGRLEYVVMCADTISNDKAFLTTVFLKKLFRPHVHS